MRILAKLDRGIQHIPKKFRFTIRIVGLNRRLPKFKRYHWALTICLRQNIKRVVTNTRQKSFSLSFFPLRSRSIDASGKLKKLCNSVA